MSTDTSAPQPQMAGLDISDSALLATLLREAPIGFAFFGTDLRFRRINRVLAGLPGRGLGEHLGRLPSQVWPETLAARVESAVRRVLEEDQPLFEADQPVSVVPGALPRTGNNGTSADATAADAAPARAGSPSAGGQDATGPGAAGPEGAAGTLAGPDTAAPAAAELRHWAFSWFPSHDPEGNITGVALIAVDVTDRQNSAEAVRRSEERYRSLVQAGAQVVWVTTPTGAIAEDSPEWRWITGQTLEEYLGSGLLDASHPEDRDPVVSDGSNREGFSGVALDNWPDHGGIPGQRLAGRDPPGGPRAGGPGLARVRSGRKSL